MFDDAQALGRRKCRIFTFDEFNSLSYVESDDSKRFSRQLRTYLPLRSSRYDVYNSRYRLSKFSYFNTLVDYTLRRLLPNDERFHGVVITGGLCGELWFGLWYSSGWLGDQWSELFIDTWGSV